MKIEECFVGQRVSWEKWDGSRSYQGAVVDFDLKTERVGIACDGGIRYVDACDLFMIITPERPVGPARADSMFPHTCPKCGGRAYVGLQRIEHPGEQGQGECP